MNLGSTVECLKDNTHDCSNQKIHFTDEQAEGQSLGDLPHVV